MHKTPIDLRRLLPLVLLTLTLLTPTFASAADSAPNAGPEQPTTPETPADIPRANETPVVGYVYTVQAGDDLWQIAVAHSLDMEALAAENHLDPPYWLQPGDKLWVPAEPALVRRPEPVLATNHPAGYTVQSGDNLFQIASIYGLTESELARANNIDPPYLIHPGDRLTIPGQPVEQQAPDQPAAETPPPAAQAPDSSDTNQFQTADSSAGQDIPGDAMLILNDMNEKRAAWGLASLVWSGQLATAAQAHANDLAQRGWGGHVGSDGAYLRTRYERVGYYASWASENWANAHGPQQAFDMWWFEPDWGPHRLNILGANFAEIGIGIARGGWGYYYVADFGSH